MTLRMKLGPGGGSPFRVVGAAADINNPALADIIFDANHSPLRLLQVGFFGVNGPGSATAGTAFGLNGVGIPPQSSWPLVIGMWRLQSNPNPANLNWAIPEWQRLPATSGGGRGGGVATQQGAVYGINWFHNLAAPGGGITQNPIYVAYAVLRNKIGA